MFIVRVRATSDMEDEIFGPFSSPQWAKRFMERMEGRGLLMDLDHSTVRVRPAVGFG